VLTGFVDACGLCFVVTRVPCSDEITGDCISKLEIFGWAHSGAHSYYELFGYEHLFHYEAHSSTSAALPLRRGVRIVAVARFYIALARCAVELAAVLVAARLAPEDPGDLVLERAAERKGVATV
jgi:hypothetical protein